MRDITFTSITAEEADKDNLLVLTWLPGHGWELGVVGKETSGWYITGDNYCCFNPKKVRLWKLPFDHNKDPQ